MSSACADLGGVRASPNIWNDPGVYEWENEAFDPDASVVDAIEDLHPLTGSRLLDIGCGAGFHLPRYAARGARVIGVEPHPPLFAAAGMRRRGGEPAMGPSVVGGEAARLPLREKCIDVVLARWAYFFGPGCEPGLREVERVTAPGGLAAFLDNDATRSTFGAWFRAANPAYDPVAVERFWRRAGYSARRVDTWWRCPDRASFEAIVALEFAPPFAETILSEHRSSSVDYSVTLWWRRF